MSDPIPVRREMCKSCPFRATGLTEYKELLTERATSAFTEGAPVCHSTGHNPKFCKVPDSPIEHACRGARDESIKAFYGIGFLDAPTDKAWKRKCKKLGMKPPPPQQF